TTPPANPGEAQNVAVVTVGGGPANRINLPFTSVTVCAPGDAASCQTIDNILVDTASTGLRIFAPQLSPVTSLPQLTDDDGSPLAACGQFADGTVWGSLRMADVRIAGEAAKSVPLQLIADPVFASVPPSCSGIGALRNTVQAFGANGVLGVSVFRQDCGATCARVAIPGTYYACPASGCKPVALGLAKQLQNPVALFAQNNNGVVVDLPAIAAEGAANVSGSLIFGIGTQANNGLGSAVVTPVDPSRGTFTTLYANRFYTGSFIDSGSNALFFNDGSAFVASPGAVPAMPACRQSFAIGFFCPTAAQIFSGQIVGANGVGNTFSFSVANAENLFSGRPGNRAFGNLAGPIAGTSFDWGLPFFFGRRIYTAIEGMPTPGGSGPYVAY
ncbi:MAG: DUF3443 domain-containing protein, partial [Rhodocyclaceae bacterium]